MGLVFRIANNYYMLKNVILFLKGFCMGLANVVPGVSGGTIALLAGVFERFIHALKSLDLEALRLLFNLKFKEFAKHTDFLFLLVLVSGEIISIFTAARLLKSLFEINNGIYVWSFFFGLIIASVYYIGKTIKKFNLATILFIILGVALAMVFCLMPPAQENSNFFYLIFCGAIAICDMLLPGISGSYTLILLGNYKLIMVDAVHDLNLEVLVPVAIGCAIGFLAFSRFLSWLLKKYWNQTIAVLTGFVFGSLAFIWPWKKTNYLINPETNLPLMDSHGDPIAESYERFLPDLTANTFIAIALVVAGIVVLCLIEELAKRKGAKAEDSAERENSDSID